MLLAVYATIVFLLRFHGTPNSCMFIVFSEISGGSRRLFRRFETPELDSNTTEVNAYILGVEVPAKLRQGTNSPACVL